MDNGRSMGAFGTEATDSYELSCLKENLGILEEQPVLIITEPSLKPLWFCLCVCFIIIYVEDNLIINLFIHDTQRQFHFVYPLFLILPKDLLHIYY